MSEISEKYPVFWENYQSFVSNREELIAKHEGKIILIVEGEFIREIDDMMKGIEEAAIEYGWGNFFIVDLGEEPRSVGSGVPIAL